MLVSRGRWCRMSGAWQPACGPAWPGCTCAELVAELPLSQSTVSQHLRELTAVGLVANEATGVRACYQLVHTHWQQARQRVMGLIELA